MGIPLKRLLLALSALFLTVTPRTCLAQALAIQVTPGGNATLSWNASATGTVNVERSRNLADPSGWSVVSAGNSNGTFTESTVGATRGFYRLVPAFTPDTMLAVQGNASAGIPNLLVANTETTWREWKRVQDWAVLNGYNDLANIGEGWENDDRQPVQSVSWFDVLKWCNAKSEMEGLTPVYIVNGMTYKTGNQIPAWNPAANGYRLPGETEWVWAASGGNRSQGYDFSGSNTIGLVAWYLDNSGGSPKPVGLKAANELDLFDMSGNVFEWCWDEGDTAGWRVLKGGFWNGGASSCQVEAYFEQLPDTRNTEAGFRVVRNAP